MKQKGTDTKITLKSCFQVAQAILKHGPKVSRSLYKSHVPKFVTPDGNPQAIVSEAYALTVLYESQLVDEKVENRTKYRNQKGFNRWDAPILTRIARKISSLGLGTLTEKDLRILKNRLPKYRRQVS